MKIRPVRSELFYLDGRTDRHDEVNICFTQFLNAPENKTHFICNSQKTWKRTEIADYFRDKNHSVKFQLETMKVFQYNIYERILQKCEVAVCNRTVSQFGRHLDRKATSRQ
jgi:hypothetical protein